VRATDVVSLLDYTAWANRRILESAREAGAATFTAPSDVTYRNLRGTLVHTLDVERSWRDRIRGVPEERWNEPLPESDFATVDDLAARWDREDDELREWLATLDDEAMAEVVDLGPKDRFPRWYFLLHVVTHSAQQRRDAAILLTLAGHPPPEIEFLYYADRLADGPDDRG
jgi:uncharacterized damage-inducible protein DinB